MSQQIRSAVLSPSLLVAAVAFLACGMSVGMDHPIQDNNEGLYARIALEMLQGHSWIIPTIDGVPYMEKPPLVYWITAASFKLLGPGEAAARMAPMMGFALLIAAIYAFARRWWGERAAVLASCVAASCPLVVVMARMLMFDMLFTGLYAWAVFALYEGAVRGRGPRWMRASYAALALAVMTKGLAALVFHGALVLAAILESREERALRLRRALDGGGIAIFLALALPWHVAASFAQPTFAWFYFINEHVLRFLGRRVPHDYYGGSYWYYIPRLVLAAAPWILVLAAPSPRSRETNASSRRFLWLAFLVPFTFFSVSGAKANYYILVALPPLMMLIGRRLDLMDGSRWPVLVPLGWAIFFALLLVAGPRFGHGVHLPAMTGPLCACALALCAISALAFAKRNLVEGAAASAAVAIPLALLFSGYMNANRDQGSMRDMSAEIERRGLHAVYVFRDYEAVSSLGYYLRSPIGIIQSASNDLWYGLRLRPDAERFPSIERFLHDARYRGVAVVVSGRRMRELQASPLATRLEPLARFGSASLFLYRR